MATSTRLTTSLIESNLKVSKEIWLSDNDGGRGVGRLVARITPNGVCRFYFRYSINGRRDLVPLGKYSKRSANAHVTLQEARILASRYSNIHQSPVTRAVREHTGLHTKQADAVRAVETSQTADSEGDARHSLLALCNAYVDGLRSRNAQSVPLYANCIKNHIAPTEWANRPAASVSPTEITALVRRVVEAGKGTTAIKVRRIMHCAYERALEAALDATAPSTLTEFNIKQNPVAATASLTSLTRPRTRALNWKELGHYWKLLSLPSATPSLAERFIRLTTLLGGQRALQLLRCELSEVDLDENMLTIHDGKGKRSAPREHVLPLEGRARDEVVWLVHHSESLGCPFLFAGKNAKQHLTEGPVSRHVRLMSRSLLAGGQIKKSFCFADLRRTIETNMASLDIPTDIRAQIQSHGLSGVQARHYDRWHYLPQKRKALAVWAAYLEECATKVGSK
jgi:integrase